MSFKASVCTCEKFLVAREPAEERSLVEPGGVEPPTS
jgi:hypothetical protein